MLNIDELVAELVDELKFDGDGLIPAIVQDYYSNEVLMMAYMNKKSIAITLDEKQTCFWSRSRNELWRKGETSSNTQKVMSIMADCDKDTLLIRVIKNGPACHTNAESCFFEEVYEDAENVDFSVQNLYKMIAGRKAIPQVGSYTSYLFEKGKEKILKKIGEESTEVVIAAMKNDNEETVYELGDLYYHALVLMAESGITIEEVSDELAKRHVVDHKVKQETMR